MKIRFFAENKKRNQVIFELTENTNSAHESKEFIVVDMNTDDRELYFKRGLITDYLHYMANHETITDWRQLDAKIAEIMAVKVHFV
jgi:hypothetical protein